MTKCEDCINTEISDWEQDVKTGKATPILWCEMHKKMCDDIHECNYFDDRRLEYAGEYADQDTMMPATQIKGEKE